MNLDPKYKKITCFVLAIVVICLIITGFILFKLVDDVDASSNEYWFFKESLETGQEIELKNAYILANENGKLEFMHDFETYVVEGNLEDVYQGVANIIISGDHIAKIGVKPGIIRVIIKNNDSIFRNELNIKKLSDSSMINVTEIMQVNGLKVLELTDEQGFVICDAYGQSLSAAYEGVFRVVKTEDGIVLVNELPMETYVKYVLPSEMPISFGAEALKAQAVCARTYAYAQMKNTSYAMYAANLDDSTDFQAYNKEGRYTETDMAVDATSDQVLTCNGELISCYYYSTSAGVTNDMSTWEGEDTAYISCAGLEFTNGLNLCNEADFSQFICSQNMCYDSISAFYRWNATLNILELKESENGKLRSIEVHTRNQAGYITEIELKYENETKVLKNENEIRKVLGKYLTEINLNNGTIRTDLSMLPSACFEVVSVSDETIILRGGGFGHGIGMSQYGAKSMAETGFSYEDIVKYYYKDVEISTK